MHMGRNSDSTRLRTFRMRTWKGSMFSLIGRVAYTFNIAVVLWPLATCGHREMLSFSRVRGLSLLVLPLFDILLDVRGKLCGEDIIRPYIDTLNLRYCLLGPVSTSDALWRSAQDWRELIPLMLNSHDISILIIDATPLGSSRTSSLPHSSTYRSSPDSSPPTRDPRGCDYRGNAHFITRTLRGGFYILFCAAAVSSSITTSFHSHSARGRW
ncbi:hypothetical protein BC826DRAFT_189230 [Russula brevipes]|nr:hypothetical protein BC826DRAFT_189230 [Russula brevipes]